MDDDYFYPGRELFWCHVFLRSYELGGGVVMGNHPEGIRQYDSHPLSPFADTGLDHDMDLTIGDNSYEAIITYDMDGDKPSVTKARINIDGVWAAIEADHFDFIESQMIAEREESKLSQKLAAMESDYDA